MNFYTSVNRLGNFLCVRGYEDGKRYARKVKYSPTLYASTPKPGAEFRSLVKQMPLEPFTLSSRKKKRRKITDHATVLVKSFFNASGHVFTTSPPYPLFLRPSHLNINWSHQMKQTKTVPSCLPRMTLYRS